jgi:3-oxoacyl-[acyl-carrier protein] reductase
LTLDLHGRVALVTGGGAGMGLEISRRLADRGADLALSYARSKQLAEAAAETLRTSGVRCVVRAADLRKVADADALVESVIAEYRRLDVVVNCAGTTRFIEFEDLAAISEDIWDDILDVNLKGAFFLSRAAGQWMRDHSSDGVIVHVASTAAFSTRGSSVPYTVAKAAVVQLTRTLAQALAPNVRVNAVAPGTVATRWWDDAAPGTLERVRNTTRFKRLATASDVAEAAVMLVTNESMSGQTVVVDLANIMH